MQISLLVHSSATVRLAQSESGTKAHDHSVGTLWVDVLWPLVGGGRGFGCIGVMMCSYKGDEKSVFLAAAVNNNGLVVLLKVIKNEEFNEI